MDGRSRSIAGGPSGSGSKTSWQKPDSKDSKYQHLFEPSTSFEPPFKQLKTYIGPQKAAVSNLEGKENEDRRPFVEKRTQNRLKCLIGKVDHAVRWCKQLKDHDYLVIYQVVGLLEHVIEKENQTLLFMKGESGQVLQCVFYSIDRKLPQFRSGSYIRSTGAMKGSNKMQIYDAEETSREEFEEAMSRLVFASQRSLNEMLKK